jgi:predicted nicotinamide N-methyase
MGPHPISFRHACQLYRQHAPWRLLREELEARGDASCWVSLAFQSSVSKCVFGAPGLSSYPPSSRYTVKVIQKYIGEVENAGEEVDEGLLKLLLDALARTRSHDIEDELCYESFQLPAAEDGEETQENEEEVISVRVSPRHNAVGLRVWVAGLYLAEFLLSEKGRSMVKGNRVLELGSGVGMTGLVCASQNVGAKSVILTDSEPVVVANLRLNSDSMPNIAVAQCDWREPLSVFEWDVDVVLAADVVYDIQVVPHLVQTLASIFQHCPTCTGLIASTIRNPETYVFFMEECARQKLVCTEIKASLWAASKPLFYYPEGSWDAIRLVQVMLPQS